VTATCPETILRQHPCGPARRRKRCNDLVASGGWFVIGLRSILSYCIQASIWGMLALVLLLSVPDAAWALQSHGPPEGLYVHQMAHVFFIGALGYLLWDIRRTSFSGRGWAYLQVFCVFMITWNILALTGHAAGLLLEPEDFVYRNGLEATHLVGEVTAAKIIYFLGKLDHLLCVPALFFLFLGLKSFYSNLETSDDQEDEK